jgi:hypothetical protein
MEPRVYNSICSKVLVYKLQLALADMRDFK